MYYLSNQLDRCALFFKKKLYVQRWSLQQNFILLIAACLHTVALKVLSVLLICGSQLYVIFIAKCKILYFILYFILFTFCSPLCSVFLLVIACTCTYMNWMLYAYYFLLLQIWGTWGIWFKIVFHWNNCVNLRHQVFQGWKTYT